MARRNATERGGVARQKYMLVVEADGGSGKTRQRDRHCYPAADIAARLPGVTRGGERWRRRCNRTVGAAVILDRLVQRGQPTG